MSIKYEVKTSNLQADTYFIKTVRGQKIPLDRLIQDIEAETSISETDVIAVIGTLIRQIEKQLLDGNEPVIDGLASFALNLKESFKTPDVTATDNAKVRIKCRVDSQLAKRVIDQVRFEKVYKQQKLPTIITFTDVNRSLENRYTAGNIAKILGHNLKFNKDEITEGIFFIASTDKTETRVTTYATTGDKELIFLVPAGLSGSQNVEIRTRYAGSTIKVGRFDKTVSQ